MEPPESLTLIEPILPKRGMLDVAREVIPGPIYTKLTGWFGSERNLGLFVAGTAAVVGVVKVVVHIRKQRRRKNWNAAGKDVVVLHTMRFAKFTPSLSPFALKLETYLKLAGIKYVVDTSEPMGPKGKLPWITFNGESIADSQLIMERLGQHFGRNFSSHLTPEEVGVGRAMRIMTEDHFLWCFEFWLFVQGGLGTALESFNLPKHLQLFFYLTKPLLKRKMKGILHVVGMGRHTSDEVEEMGRKDIAALSSWLGNKKFFTGDEPAEVDCALFGFLAQFVWNFPDSPYGNMLKNEFPNLTQYCHRMKETVWPDWEKHLNSPQA